MFRELDIENWNRKTTFEFFKDYQDPFFNLTANLDVTALYDFCKNTNWLFRWRIFFILCRPLMK